MSVQVIDNFSYKGKKGNFERDNFDTLQAMRSYPEDGIDEGHVCFCNEDGNHYKFNHLNSVDGTTGRWRLHNKSVNTLTETGEGKVLDARQGKILKDLIDAKVIEEGGVSFDTVPTKGSTNPVTSNGIREAMDEQAESINANTGVDDYPVFSTSEAYAKGKVVSYNGKLYQFTANHVAGAWTGTDVEETDVVKAHIVQELGASENDVISQKGVTDNFNVANMMDALELIPTKNFNFNLAPRSISINLGNRLMFFNAKVEITTSIVLTGSESLHFYVHNITNTSYFNSVNKTFTGNGNKLSVEIKASDFVRNEEQENLITKAQIVIQYENSDRACTFTIDKFDISGDAYYALKKAKDDKVIYETVPSIQGDIESLSDDLDTLQDNFNVIPFRQGYFDNNGSFNGSETAKAIVNYPVKAGDVYSFSGKFYQYGLFLIKDTDSSILDIIPHNINTSYNNFVFTVPENGKLCAWSIVNDDYDLILYKVTPILDNNNIGGAAYQGKLLSDEVMNISTLLEDMFKKTDLSEYIKDEVTITTSNQRVHIIVPKYLFDEGDVLFVDLKCTAILNASLYLKSNTNLGTFNFSYEEDEDGFVHAKLRIPITNEVLSLSSISNGIEVLDFFTQVTSGNNDTIAFDKAYTYINKAVDAEKVFVDAYEHVTTSYTDTSPESQYALRLNAEITRDYFNEVVGRVGKFVVKTQFRSRDNSGNVGGFYIQGSSAVWKFNLSFASDGQGGYVTPMYYYGITEADFGSSDKITIIVQFNIPLKTDRYTWEVLEVLDNRIDVIENEIENLKDNSATVKIASITDTLEIPFRGYSAMTPITVKKDGSGDFTTIQDAINSITDASVIKQYDIQVYDDFEITELKDLYVSTGEKNTSDNPTREVAFIWTKNWVHIRGMKGHGNRLYIESPSDIASTTFQYVQVIKAQGNCIINNFYVGIKGGRYAIHQESGGSKTHIDYHAHTIYKDLVIEHKGNDSYPNGNGWTSTMAQANGTTSGLKQTYINCKWISANKNPFYTHTNSEFDEPNEQIMINCSIICTSKNIKISDMGQYWGDIGSGQKAILKFIGCNIANFKSAAGYGSTRGTETTNNVRVKYGYNGGAELQGYGNTPMAVVQTSKPCLTFNTIANNKQIDVVGGTAYDLLWEKTWEKIKGTAANQGFCVGSIRLASAMSWASNSQVFCLPYILGNCASSPKTLIVKVDEQEYTITFNKNYMTADGSSYSWNTEPAVSNSQVIADINAVQPTIFKASFNSPIQELYTFEDCQELGINASTSVISAGKCLKRSLTGHQMWEIAQDGDTVEGVAGNWMIPIDYADGDNVFGRILLPKKSYFPVGIFGLSGVTAGTMYKAANSGKLVITEDKSDASFIAVDSGYLIGI